MNTPSPRNRSFNLPHRQRGAALVIGLVLLTVLTVLTASSMNASTVSLRMADNVKQQDIAAQAAESALMQSLTSNAPFILDGTIAIDEEVRAPLVYSYEGTGAGTAETTVTTLLRDRLSPATGCEMDDQFGSSAGCTYQHFLMEATTTSSRGSVENQGMGFYIRVPN